MSGRSARVVAVCVPVLFVGACGSGDAFTGIDGGDDGTADGGGSDGGCDSSQSPKTNACVISDAMGVFVAPSGSDTAQGTMSDPFATVTRGILAASGAHKRVYLCAATYFDQAVLDASANGVSIYGGLACPGGDAGASWSYTGRPATIAPATGYALEIDTVSMAVVIEDIELAAHDAATPGGSSIAAFVNGAASVDFVRVTLSAGAGAEGTSAAAVTGQPDTTTNGNGGSSSGVGGLAVTCSCANGGMSIGGAGGNGGLSAQTAGSPGSAMPTVAGTGSTDGAGGPAGCYAGHAGGAAPGGNGGGGAMTLGGAREHRMDAVERNGGLERRPR